MFVQIIDAKEGQLTYECLVIGPHIGLQNAWPMSLLIQAQTSDNDEEITGCLQLVLNSSKLGLIHESVNVNYAGSYTRAFLSLLLPSFIPLFGPTAFVARDSNRPNRELVCLGEWGICRDYFGSGKTEATSYFQGSEALHFVAVAYFVWS